MLLILFVGVLLVVLEQEASEGDATAIGLSIQSKKSDLLCSYFLHFCQFSGVYSAKKEKFKQLIN